MQMNINILLIIALALCLWRAYRGFRVGMAEEIYRLISLVVALFVLALSIMAISSFMDHNTKNGIVAVILIIITGIVFHLLSIVLNSLKTVAKLPIISFFNSILGIAAGVLEVAVAFWILYIIIQNSRAVSTVMDTGSVFRTNRPAYSMPCFYIFPSAARCFISSQKKLKIRG